MSWTIGDLAQRLGVTARALRHWEREGLLPRPPRTAGGYRLYEREHLLRLLQIKALRQSGLSVSEIRTCLETSSPQEIEQMHIRRTREHVALQESVCRRLEDLLEHVEEAGAESFLQAIEEMARLDRSPTPEFQSQVDRLDELRREVGLHPVVMMRGIMGLEAHLATLSELQFPEQHKQALLARTRELVRLSTELGRHPAVRAKALQMLQRRLKVDSPEAAMEILKQDTSRTAGASAPLDPRKGHGLGGPSDAPDL